MLPILILLVFWTSSLFCPVPVKDYIRALKGDKNLEGAYLAGFNFSGTDFSHANLKNAILTGAILKNTNLAHADLTNANLTGTDLRNIQAENANFTNIKAKRANFVYAQLAHALFIKANLKYANFNNANLENANFTDAKLTHAVIDLANHTTKNSDNISIASFDNDNNSQSKSISTLPTLCPPSIERLSRNQIRYTYTTQQDSVMQFAENQVAQKTFCEDNARLNNNDNQANVIDNDSIQSNSPEISQPSSNNNNDNDENDNYTFYDVMETYDNLNWFMPPPICEITDQINRSNYHTSTQNQAHQSSNINSPTISIFMRPYIVSTAMGPLNVYDLQYVYHDDLEVPIELNSASTPSIQDHGIKNLIQLKIDSEEAQEECPICSDNKVTFSTPCLHKFCKTCITKWLKEHNTCPICRQIIQNVK